MVTQRYSIDAIQAMRLRDECDELLCLLNQAIGGSQSAVNRIRDVHTGGDGVTYVRGSVIRDSDEPEDGVDLVPQYPGPNLA